MRNKMKFPTELVNAIALLLRTIVSLITVELILFVFLGQHWEISEVEGLQGASALSNWLSWLISLLQLPIKPYQKLRSSCSAGAATGAVLTPINKVYMSNGNMECKLLHRIYRKDLKDLNLPQLALLPYASMLWPILSSWRPAQERRNLVYLRWRDKNLITAEQYEKKINAPITEGTKPKIWYGVKRRTRLAIATV